MGQGLSVVVETKNHTVIYDTGPKWGKKDAGLQVVSPYLKSRNIKKIDTLIISHGDNDHIGGMQSILNNFEVKEIMTSEVIGETFESPLISPKLQLCYAGQSFIFDNVLFEMLHPDSLKTKKRNDHSCVLRISSGESSVLLTGDIESKSEIKMIEKYKNKLKSTVLLVPHHGSRTSSSLAFLKQVDPKMAIIPVGYNSYGHPKPEIVKRYQDLGITLYDSIQDGMVSFVLDKNFKTPISYRKINWKYWYQ